MSGWRVGTAAGDIFEDLEMEQRSAGDGDDGTEQLRIGGGGGYLPGEELGEGEEGEEGQKPRGRDSGRHDC